MNEFFDSLCIMNVQFVLNDLNEMNKNYIDFTIKTTINNQERMMNFSIRLQCYEDGEMLPATVFALEEKRLGEASEEEYQLRMNLKTYRNELFKRLKQENSIRLHMLFL